SSFLLSRPPPRSTLFPYTTLFRSFQTALASIKLIQASAVLDLTEDDFDFLTSNKVWIATDRSRARRCVEACVYGTLDFVGKECRIGRPTYGELVKQQLVGAAESKGPGDLAKLLTSGATWQVN